ncbi:Ion channel [Nesidiocoris tenuis]|uniref:Ion channel n=1 Tax=Nesidiocoris tenuis TaxID=355587 RepID=A0ABN7AWV7_9HEMI|nr:Ion channel [Nesidiocoris tenuis]
MADGGSAGNGQRVGVKDVDEQHLSKRLATDGAISSSKNQTPVSREEAGQATVTRRPSRRSPTTGHRRKKVDLNKQRSQSSPREATGVPTTSSDDDGPQRKAVLSRRKSMSPDFDKQNDQNLSSEPKKVLRRRHRLKEKLPLDAGPTQQDVDQSTKPASGASVKPQKTPRSHKVLKTTPSTTSTEADSKPSTEGTQPPIPASAEKQEVKSENKHVDNSVPSKILPRDEKIDDKIEHASFPEKRRDQNGKSAKSVERKIVEPQIAEKVKTTDHDHNMFKLDGYLTSDDDIAKEFVRIVAQSKKGLTDKKDEDDNAPRHAPSKIAPDVSPVPAKTPQTQQLEPTVKSWLHLVRDSRIEFRKFCREFPREIETLKKLRNRCASELLLMFIFCGCGAFVFKTTEGAFEAFYKCGVKRVKREFVEDLWRSSHFMPEDEWKSKARRKLWEFENQLQEAFEAGLTTYSGQRSWSFINGIIYCLTVVTTIGYGHIAPVTNSGRALTIAYSIIGIPLFLILLADFGKLFTRGIKFLWAFVRRLYYTGSCRKVRRTAPVQEVMKGVQLVYESIRRPSMFPDQATIEMNRRKTAGDTIGTPGDAPSTPALSAFAIDDEFNIPISVAITILLVYIFLGATVFWFWEEEWTFFEAFYFVFISMSTIGFGDLVPKNQMYMMASIVYLAFGLALTSMCINVVQEKLSDTFRKASSKIGATIGLKVSEDDGTISPVSPTHVEIAQVHGTTPSKSPSHARDQDDS